MPIFYRLTVGTFFAMQSVGSGQPSGIHNSPQKYQGHVMRIFVCLFLVFGFLTSDTYADMVVADSGVGGAGGVNTSVVSDLAAMMPAPEGQVAAGSASFDPTVPTITGVEWTGIYEGAAASDDFTINFYNFIAGFGPLGLVASFDLGDGVNRSESGIGDIYEYSAQIELNPEQFAINFLYISIQNDTAGDDADWSWGALTPAGCSCVTDTFLAGSLKQIQGIEAWDQLEDVALDFRLLSNVPEPSSLLLSCGVACTLLARRRRHWQPSSELSNNLRVAVHSVPPFSSG